MESSHIQSISLLVVVGTLVAAYHFVQVNRTAMSSLPGPWYTKFTSYVLTYHLLAGNRPLYIHALHQKYGRIVRISPTEVSVTDLDSVKKIYAIADGFMKSQWYTDLTPVGVNVFSATDSGTHRRHRRLLGHAMSESSLKNYSATVRRHIDFAVERMRQEHDARGAADIWKWWLFMATDIIGELTFGESFRVLEQGKKSGYTADLERLTLSDAIRLTFPNVARILPYLPIAAIQDATTAAKNMWNYAGESLDRYRNLLASDSTRARQTLFTRLFQAKDDEFLSHEELLSNAAAYIIAGSDTNSNTLTYLVWSVCRRPQIKEKLMKEIATLPVDYSDQDVQTLSYLNQIIQETLRLYSVVPAGLPRVVPLEGAKLANHWIPGGITVSAQAYSMHRDPTIFPNPEEFRPERWEEPTKEMKAAFMGFGLGSRVCLGIHLAYMELRLSIVKFFREFPNAVISSKDGMSDKDMKPALYFLMVPQGSRCLIGETP